MEYEMAPSGYVHLYNYKEPFMPVENGFGYQGVLLVDGGNGEVQCHICGQWFDGLGTHIARHAITASRYKQKFGLNNNTALLSEKVREKLVVKGMEQRLQNLKNFKGTKRSEETKAKIKATQLENRRENQNKTGTCPAQLIKKIQDRIESLNGQVPNEKEMSDYKTIAKVFGTWNEAIRMAGYTPRKAGQNVKHWKLIWTEEKAIEWVRMFFESKNIIPTHKDMPQSLYEACRTGRLDKKQIFEKAITLHGKYVKVESRIAISKEDLLTYLINFSKYHNRRPSYSDARRGLIPNLSRYSYHFGSWKEALKLANV